MIIQSVADAQVLAASHMHSAFAIAFGGNPPPGLSNLESGGVLLITNEPHPLGNFSIGQSEDEVNSVAKSLAETGMPACMLFVRGLSDDSQATGEAHGFTQRIETPAMAGNIDGMPKPVLPEGYLFERFMPEHSAASWTQALAAGYDLPLKVAEAVSPTYVPVTNSDDDAFQFFWVRQSDKIAGVSALCISDGVAGIYCVAVTPEHRRRGLGAVLTAGPLKKARELGYRVGVLQAATMGYSVYRSLGFEDVNTVQMLLRLPQA